MMNQIGGSRYTMGQSKFCSDMEKKDVIAYKHSKKKQQRKIQDSSH